VLELVLDFWARLRPSRLSMLGISDLSCFSQQRPEIEHEDDLVAAKPQYVHPEFGSKRAENKSLTNSHSLPGSHFFLCHRRLGLEGKPEYV
jgi:hypothetical protein